MAENQVPLQRLKILTADNLVREETEAGIHAVDGRTAVDDFLDDACARRDARLGLIGQLEPNRLLISFAQLRQRQRRVHRKAHARSPSEGKCKCSANAVSRAISYPASACRMTPVAGSFQSTRASFSLASAVPSATMT